MQFRVQYQKIQCIRSKYNPKLKRNIQKVVYTIPVSRPVLPAETPELTAEERLEFQKWLDNKRENEMLEHYKNTIDFVSVWMQSTSNAITKGYKTGRFQLSDEKAAEIWQAMNDLQKTLRKHGHPKPKQQTVALTADEKQVDLLTEVEDEEGEDVSHAHTQQHA